MSYLSPAFWAVIPAAGVGARMAADRPKQYLQLGGRSILYALRPTSLLLPPRPSG